jgi:hypothetical protein
VSSEKEYRAYADECLGWAKTAQTEREREIFLQMAEAWLRVAFIAKGREPPFLPPSDLAPSSRDKDDNATA